MYDACISSAKCEAKITREGADRLHVRVVHARNAVHACGSSIFVQQRFLRDDRQRVRAGRPGSEAFPDRTIEKSRANRLDRSRENEPCFAGLGIEAHRNFPLSVS